MRLQKYRDETGNATLEFAILTGLFLAPILTANQALMSLNQRQVALESMAETLARSASLARNPEIATTLAGLLASDAGLDTGLLSLSINCEPAAICDHNSKAVRVKVEYKTLSATSSHILNDAGSVLPFGLALLSIGLAFALATANVQSETVFIQRTDELARFLAEQHFSDSSFDSLDVTREAAGVASELSMKDTRVTSAWLSRPESQTLQARVCTSFELPIRVFNLGGAGTTCRDAKMRSVS